MFYAFDIVFNAGTDLRFDRLSDRKQVLRSVVRSSECSRLLYVDHVEGAGIALFDRVCQLDLEGVVAKYKYGPYVSDVERSTWVKIRNREYSQWAGRDELFERDRHREPVAGWHACDHTLQVEANV